MDLKHLRNFILNNHHMVEWINNEIQINISIRNKDNNLIPLESWSMHHEANNGPSGLYNNYYTLQEEKRLITDAAKGLISLIRSLYFYTYMSYL